MLRFLSSSLQKIKNAFGKTQSFLSGRLKQLFGKKWNAETAEELEKILYEADFGTQLVQELLRRAREYFQKHPSSDLSTLKELLHESSLQILSEPAKVEPSQPQNKKDPFVVFIVGINGSGKTTSIAKLANHFKKEGKSVLLAAGDTFRAAAVEQLTIWSDRLGLQIVKGAAGADPSAIVFDALTAAKARGIDIVLIDTAGRLQNKTDLMQELQKMRRVAQKVVSDSPHETLLVLDATSGQNALDQAQTFHQFTPLTAIALTKIDGSAKGGMALAIYHKMGIPIRWIGVGEAIDDWLPFDAKAYVDALFS